MSSAVDSSMNGAGAFEIGHTGRSLGAFALNALFTLSSFSLDFSAFYALSACRIVSIGNASFKSDLSSSSVGSRKSASLAWGLMQGCSRTSNSKLDKRWHHRA